jgi:hypothetical protein
LKDQNLEDKCPECGCLELLGLYASFWVELNKEGDSLISWADFESNTEITDKRQCFKCHHIFTI